jgi:hypothetical protein
MNATNNNRNGARKRYGTIALRRLRLRQVGGFFEAADLRFMDAADSLAWLVFTAVEAPAATGPTIEFQVLTVKP